MKQQLVPLHIVVRGHKLDSLDQKIVLNWHFVVVEITELGLINEWKLNPIPNCLNVLFSFLWIWIL
jgi:hypothetical protein